MITSKTVLTIDPAAYIKRTAKLDFEAQGFYVRLLACVNGRTDNLPETDRELGLLMKCDVRRVRRIMRLIRRAGLIQTHYSVKGAA